MTGARGTADRGRCPVCLRYFSLSKAGRLRVHATKGTRDMCPGSGEQPA